MNWHKELVLSNKTYNYLDLGAVAKTYHSNLTNLPYSIRVLLESVARQMGEDITIDDVASLANWQADNPQGVVPFKVARVILQDFTGVPAVVDLAAMRDAMVALDGKAADINPDIPVTLVIDHSVQVDQYGNKGAIAFNTAKEFERNNERYEFLKWAQSSFENFDVVPPETGIIHQVNLEVLSEVILTEHKAGIDWLLPDTLQGTDSHTTMINGLGVLGWGVGGIEAEAALLGEASFFPTPEVIGVRFVGTLSPGATATDLVLSITETLRKENVVGKFVEFFGPSYHELSLADRATIANMAPEYGATCGFCPIDDETLRYLKITGRSETVIERVETYAKQNHLFYDDTIEPTYTKVITVDLATILPALAGPKRPQDRILLTEVAQDFHDSLTAPVGPKGFGLSAEETEKQVVIEWDQEDKVIQTGDLLLAAITSCTNTSNPFVMLSAGLLAKNAVEKGLRVPDYVKTSLAPGSKIVTSYLEASGLMPYLEKLGFYLVGYGCTTCIGNSGPLADEITEALQKEEMLVSSVLSGNRNFEGRIHPLIKANYLASPPLVVAYALAGTVTKDLTTEPIGVDASGQAIMLSDIWPDKEEVQRYIDQFVSPEAFRLAYGDLFSANERWNAIDTTHSDCYSWDELSTYIAHPPYFKGLTRELPEQGVLTDLRILAKLGDSVTTDHISPAGSIALHSAAGKYLKEKGLRYSDFNSYGSRRGNHEIMMRGTFGNIRLQNQLVPEISGGYTRYLPTGEEMFIYDAALRYQEANINCMILAGKDYGMGSSRDWAAKGTQLLGVKVVLAESFERIHRSNLVMMGVVPLEYLAGDTAESLGLTGTETFQVLLPEEPTVNQLVQVIATDAQNHETSFMTRLRFDAPADIRYWKHQGILPMVIRKKLSESAGSL